MGIGSSKGTKETTDSGSVENTSQEKGFNVSMLHAATKGVLKDFLSIKDKGNLANAEVKDELDLLVTRKPEVWRRTDQGTSRFFKQQVDEAKRAYPLLKAVITGHVGANPEEKNPDSLMSLVKKNPNDLFLKGDISFPNGCDLYLVPELPYATDTERFIGQYKSQYKGCYVWINNQDLIYVHYDGVVENVHLDNVNTFKSHIRWLSKKEVLEAKVIALSNQNIKKMITNNGGHKPMPHQYFHRVSAFQLMRFLCDMDMITHVMQLVLPLPEELDILMKSQLKELGTGGADIIKVDRDPQGPQFTFEDLLHYKTTYHFHYYADRPVEVTIPLLENRDGLVYYKDPQGTVHLYRACATTRTIEPIDLHLIEISEHLPLNEQQLLIEEKRIFDKMMANIDAMEPMSAKRSSNDEHRVIAKTMRYSNKPVQLHREGITFELEGVRFQSSYYDFNRHYNAYRKCHRFYAAGPYSMPGKQAYCQELGHVQKEVMWWLQRLLEDASSNIRVSPFRRSFNMVLTLYGNELNVNVFSRASSHFAVGLGSVFAIKKSGFEGRGYGKREGSECHYDLIVGIQLMEEAKTTLFEPDFNQHVVQDSQYVL